MLLQQDQTFGMLFASERVDLRRMLTEHCFDFLGRNVSALNPYDAGTSACDLTPFLEVGVLRYDRACLRPRELPDLVIACAIEPCRLHMQGIRKKISKEVDQPW